MRTDTNSPNSDVFLRSKGWIPWRSIVDSRLVLLTTQHHSKDPTGKLRHEWDTVGYYLCSDSNGWTWRFRNGLLHLLGVRSFNSEKEWHDRSVCKIIEVCQKAIPAQTSNEPNSQEWTQMFVYSTIGMLERVNGTGELSAHIGGTLTMLGLCQSDVTGPATPKYTICPCLHRVTHAEEKCSHCGVMTPLSTPAGSSSDSKERKDLKPGESNFMIRFEPLWKSCKLFMKPKPMYRCMVSVHYQTQ